MAKRERTPEQIAAAKERMAKVRAARQNKNPQTKTPEAVNLPEANGIAFETPDEPIQTIADQSDVAELKRQVQELKDMMWQQMLNQTKQNGNTTVANGQLTGTFEKYSTENTLYPSPVERLKVEQRLQRFAFPINYDLNYTVGVSEYETIDHVRTKEPKFNLELVRIIMDEDTGEPTDGRYVVCQLIMHEDPDAALVIARDNDLVVEEENETKFLNEMRYLRMRDWLLECFYPAPVKKERLQREMVVNGKLVTYYEVNNEEGKGMTKENWDNAPKIRF